MDVKSRLSRRQFLKRASVTVGAAVGAPWLVPSSALGADGMVAPGNRITLACIGVGGMGTGNLQSFLNCPDAQVVAVCDVDQAHRDRAQKIADEAYGQQFGKTYRGCATYNDFREVLARNDIDAVAISTPDHWHAPIAIAAAKAGKDVFGEKPLALTIGQGRQISDTMKRYGRVFQCDSWQRSVASFRFACELVRNGRIGTLHTVKVGLPPGLSMEPQPEMPVPPGFDYEMWLGPAPWTPYTEKRCHYNFRFNFDYSGGKVTDWGAHHHDIVQWAMGTDHTGPTEIQGQGIFPKNNFFNVPTDFEFECRYANGVRMITSNKLENGVFFEGSEGWIFIARERMDAHPKSLLSTSILPSEIRLYQSENHYFNFLECIRTRAETAVPAEIAHRSISIAHLGNIAMRLGRKLRWDPERERFADDPEADRMIMCAMRSPWQL